MMQFCGLNYPAVCEVVKMSSTLILLIFKVYFF